MKPCSANKEYTVNWNGKKSNGKYVGTGKYYAKVYVGKKYKKSPSIKFYTKSDFAGGDGSSAKPYQVTSTAHLKKIALHNGRRFIQTKDISFKSGKNVPLFSPDAGFSGVYDGNGKTICDISYLSDENYLGIFRCISSKGSVKNLKVKDINFSGHDCIGIISGYNYGKISKCFISNCSVIGSTFLGMVAGVNERGTIENCSSTQNMINGTDKCGGITGWNNGTVKNCTSKKDTVDGSNTGDLYISGIAAYNKGTISNCTVTDDNLSATRSSCYSFTSACLGGICGYAASGIIKGCYVDDSKGLFKMKSAESYIGGIVGYRESGIVANDNAYIGKLNTIGSN